MKQVKWPLILLSLLLSVSPLVWSQTITENLSTLGSLIDNALNSIENIESENNELQITLENLEASLRTQSALLREQGKLLNEQEQGYTQQSLIYEKQSEYLQSLQFKYKIYKVSLIVAVPTCIGLGVWLGYKLTR